MRSYGVSKMLVGLAAGVAALAGCHDLDPLSPPASRTGSADFTRYVAVGNSLTAGFQSGGLVETFQEVSYPALIANAARSELFVQPLISEPGIPPLLILKSIVPIVDLDTLSGNGLPTNSNYSNIFNNLGIPGATLNELRTQGPVGSANPFFQIVLRNPILFGLTAIRQAQDLQPTFATVWAGSNDILGSVLKGTDALLTGAASFEADYRSLINELKAASPAVVAANLPDIASIPFTTTVPPILVDPLTREPILDPQGQVIPLIGEFQGGSGPLPPGTLLLLPAASLIAQKIGVPPPFGTGQALPDSVVLDPTELGNIVTRLMQFNAIIDSICANRNVPVVDMFDFFNDVKVNGLILRGNQRFTIDYISGGLFSLDGIHPSTVGYWVVAREFIKTINANFGASIPDPPLRVVPLSAVVPPAGPTGVSPLEYAAALPAYAFDGLKRIFGSAGRR